MWHIADLTVALRKVCSGPGPQAVGSGGPYAQSAAQALLESSTLGAREIVERALLIAADICIYTNRSITIEELASP